jgi:hypothetical protein
MSEVAKDAFEGWAILELMGHRRLAGYVREQNVAGAGFLRIDVPDPKEDAERPFSATQLYAPGAIYCITPTTEDIACRLARASQPAPVSRWELPPAKDDREDADLSHADDGVVVEEVD